MGCCVQSRFYPGGKRCIRHVHPCFSHQMQGSRRLVCIGIGLGRLESNCHWACAIRQREVKVLIDAGGGLASVHMSWSYSEYLYMLLLMNNTELPPEALFIIRYHKVTITILQPYMLHSNQAPQYAQLLGSTKVAIEDWLSMTVWGRTQLG